MDIEGKGKAHFSDPITRNSTN